MHIRFFRSLKRFITYEIAPLGSSEEDNNFITLLQYIIVVGNFNKMI